MTVRSASGGPRQIGSHLAKVTRRVLGRRGLGEAEVILRWPVIVGERLARQCLPEKLSHRRGAVAGGVLHVCVEPAAATVIQHMAPVIVERINTYYGYRAVERLQLRQQPLPKPQAQRRPPPRALSAHERAALERLTAGAGDSALRAALRSLGAGIIARKLD